jgi:hypothetical protein
MHFELNDIKMHGEHNVKFINAQDNSVIRKKETTCWEALNSLVAVASYFSTFKGKFC